MKDALVIAGSQSLSPSIPQISALITTLPDLLICGCAEGVDRCGYEWARRWNIPVEFYPAWAPQMRWALAHAINDEIVHRLPHIKGPGAGMARNNTMAYAGNRLVLIWDGASPGSRDMRDAALRLKLPIVSHIWRPKAAA